jgi:hypothetical protein
MKIETLFAHTPPLDLYITGGGRLVCPNPLPKQVVEIVRNVSGQALQDPFQERPVEERDDINTYGEEENTFPEFITTNDGKRLLSGFMHHLRSYCYGSPAWQECELQICRGCYKQEFCRHAPLGKCNKLRLHGHKRYCTFIHPDDVQAEVEAVIYKVRQRVFKEMHDKKYALPAEIRHEINRMDDAEYNAVTRLQFTNPRGNSRNRPPIDPEDQGKGNHPGKGKRSNRSRSPKGSGGNRTPTPPGKEGKGRRPIPAMKDNPAVARASAPAAVEGNAPDAEEVDRSRDHSSGAAHVVSLEEDEDDEEVAAPDNSIIAEQDEPTAPIANADVDMPGDDNEDAQSPPPSLDYGASMDESNENTIDEAIPEASVPVNAEVIATDPPIPETADVMMDTEASENQVTPEL